MTDFVQSFLNALQLSIPNRIIDSVNKLSHKPILLFHFAQDIKNDGNIKKFFGLLAPNIKWLNANTLEWSDATDENIQTITELLILTRLNDENLKKISELNSKFEPWVSKLNLTSQKDLIKNNLNDLVFSHMQKKRISQDGLAKSADLSLVSLYKFKKGGDIRLSNFLKILDALDLEIQIKERK